MRRPPRPAPPYFPPGEEHRPDLLLRYADLTRADRRQSVCALATVCARGDLPRCVPRLDLPSGRGPVDDPNVAVRGILQREACGRPLIGDGEDWEALVAWWDGVRARGGGEG